MIRLLLKICLSLALAYLLVTNLTSALNRIRLWNPSGVAFNPQFRIDSETFVAAGEQMHRDRSLFFPERYHNSLGMKVVMALWFRAGGGNDFYGMKLINFALYLATIGILAVAVARATQVRLWGLVFATLVSYSVPYATYTATLQYEIILSFVVALAFFLCLGPLSPRRCFALGFLLALAPLFRSNFLLLFPCLVLALAVQLKSGERKAVLIPLTLGFLFLALPWNLAHTIHSGQPYFYERVKVSPFKRGLNPDARGYNFPYPKKLEPSGLAFVQKYPVKYANLVWLRLEYLAGLWPDIWFVESYWTELTQSQLGWDVVRSRRLVVYLSVLLLACGVLANLKTPYRGRAYLLGLAVVTLSPHFFIGASTRFAVPIYPILIFFQTLGLHQICRLTESGYAAARPAELRHKLRMAFSKSQN